MKRRITVMLIAVMVFTMIPVTAAHAASSLDLSDATADRAGSGWQWDNDVKTLTLYGAELNFVYLPAGSTVRHTGRNECNLIYCYGDMTVRGSGNLASNLNCCDGDGDMVIEGGIIEGRTVVAKNLTFEKGYVKLDTTGNFDSVHIIDGKYIQNGGYMSIRAAEGKNGMTIHGLGAEINGGYLEVIANTEAGNYLAAIWCQGNEFINSNGVIKAVNNGKGYAIRNHYDALVAAGGVTMAKTAGSQAISGYAYTLGDEKHWSSLSPSGEGSPLGRTVTANSEELFAKYISAVDVIKPDHDIDMLDGLYRNGSVSVYESTREGDFKELRLTGASYICSADGSALSLNPHVNISDSGTLVCEGGKNGIYCKYESQRAKYVGSGGTLVAIGNTGCGIYVHSSNTSPELSLNFGDIIAVSHGGEAASAIRSTGRLDLQDTSLQAYSDGEGSLGAIKTSELIINNSSVTARAAKSTAVSTTGLLYSETAKVSLTNSSLSAYSEDKNGFDMAYEKEKPKASVNVSSKSYFNVAGKSFHNYLINLQGPEMKLYTMDGLSGKVSDRSKVSPSESNYRLDNIVMAVPAGYVDQSAVAETVVPASQVQEPVLISLSGASCTVTAPEAGDAPAYQVTVPASANYTASVDKWYKDSSYHPMDASGTFEPGSYYIVEVTFTPKDGYKFENDEQGTFNVNGNAAKLSSYNTITYSMTVRYTFKCEEEKPVHVHKYSMICGADEHWQECECGDVINKEPHAYGEWTVAEEPTETMPGRECRVCAVCGAEEGRTIPVKAPEEKPQTGETPEEKELTTPFVDVPKDAYYYDATVWAFNAEPQITDGNGKDKFMPEQICTRGQVVTFLWRSAGQPAPAKSVNPFEDVKQDDYFYQPVLWAFYHDAQITDGTDPTHFSPNNPCKNSHILTFIWRALGEPGKTENAATWYTDAYNWAKYDADLLTGTFEGSYDINAQCPRKNVVQYLYRYYVMSGK